MKYLAARGVVDPADRKVWAFMGDGEMDEPESMGAISLAGREKLDNLIFVVNCNLQRLDGPVRGNGKIIQELETNFRGAGWNVIKVIWGSGWDPLLEADTEGWLHFRMEEAVDGEYQTFKAKDGAYVREHFFGKYPETRAMVADWSDEQIWELRRGGHDPQKVYAAYAAAVANTGSPTVILAKTIKGFGMGEAGEGRNITHQQKSMNEEARLAIRDRLGLPLTDEEATGAFFHRPSEDSPELRYLLERRAALGGSLPARHREADPLPTPPPFTTVLEGSGERENSTTMAFVRILNSLVRDATIGERVVPIVPDESRTFGMEGMFRQLGIFSQVGQLYQPEDAEDFMFYREDEHGQILQEGINEPGAFSSWIAAATSYANHGLTMVPFYVFYSMFGFQRVGDLAWAAGDSRARGFLIGATAGRTTLNGEGLQHEDGHSHILASVVPNCRAYDPTYGYELAVIVREGMRRMCEEQEDVFYYLTVMNENYVQPALPEGSEEGILRGIYLLREGAGDGPRAPAARLRRDPPRGDRGRRSPRERLRRRERRLERHELHGAPPRRPGSRALEPPPPDRRATALVRRDGARGSPGAVRRRDRLHAHVRRPDPAVRSRSLRGARHGRLRSQRLSRQAARVLRGRPSSRGGGGPESAGRRRRRRGDGRAGCDRALRDRRRRRGPLEALSHRPERAPRE